jgi:hypothetical protein
MESLPILVPLVGGVFAVFTCITCCMRKSLQNQQRLLMDRVENLETQVVSLNMRSSTLPLSVPQYTTQPPPMRSPQPQQPIVLPQYPYPYMYATAPPPQPQPQQYMKSV